MPGLAVSQECDDAPKPTFAPVSVPSHRFSRLILAALGIAVSIAPLIGLGSVRMTNGDEVCYPEAAREMVETGDYLTPKFNYEPFLHKPALIYWLIAASYRALGCNEFSARLPSALAGIASLGLAWALGRRLSGALGGWACLLILGTQQYQLGISQSARPDALWCLWTWLAWYGFVLAHFAGSRAGSYLMWLAMGLGVLTRGPIGVVLPLLPIGAFLLVNRRLDAVKKLCPAWGLAAMLAVALPWYVAMTVRHRASFYDDIILWESFGRFLGFGPESHDVHGLLFGPKALALNLLPWTLLLIPLLLNDLGRLRGRDWRSGPTGFFWMAFLVTLAFFSMSSYREARYLSPCGLPVAVLMGSFLSEPGAGGSRRAVRGLLAVVVVATLVLLFAVPLWLGRTALPEPLGLAGLLVTLGGAAVGVVAAVVAGREKAPACAPLVAAPALALAVFLNTQVWPLINRAQPYADFAVRMRQAGYPHIPVVSYGVWKGSLLFYLQGPVAPAAEADTLQSFLAQNPTAFVVLPEEAWQRLPERLRHSLICLASGSYLPDSDNGTVPNLLLALRPAGDGRLILARSGQGVGTGR